MFIFSKMYIRLSIYGMETLSRHIGTVLPERENLWSDGYFAASIGQVSQTTIEQYIEIRDSIKVYKSNTLHINKVR